MKRDELAAHLAELASQMNEVELGIITTIAERLVILGRESYGPMLLQDRRDDVSEATEECFDGLVYLGRMLYRMRAG